MGALTDHRKRCFVDLCLPFSPHSLFDSSSSPSSKKPKLQFLPSTPDRAAPPPSLHSLPSSPLPSPLPRPLHGPQRVLKAFGLGLAGRAPLKWFSRTDRSFDMGNFVSRLFQQKKAAWSALSSRRKGEASVSENGSHERLRLEEYKRLVVDSQEEHSGVVSDSAKVGLLRSFASAVSDLTIVTRKDEELSDPHVLSRKVEDARKVALEAIPVREERAWVKKGPLYKELYEEAKKHDSKLSRLELEVKLTKEKISRFRLASEALREKPKEDLHELFTPLTDEEENEVSCALWGGSSREVLVTHEASNIEITREILQCLSSGAWLNDEVINVYLELLQERERREPGKFLKCHFFNTFFYKKLNSGRNGYDFKAVRRWTTQKKLGYGLIEYDKIFVPVHKDIHWCLAVINVKNETLQYLDSLGGMDTVVLRVLATYFMDEVKDKSDKQIDTTLWKQESVDNLPLQKNGWDCGMFMLKYTDFYSRGLSLSFSQEHMEYFRKRTAKEILRLRAE
ncbi:ubiquitin-like-specific protease ESD4 [Cocos nucifera]|uniref:Ubiquitin-like-specific protease ESD4 n=1 Tax=Cocos nucifera TaxID=13894 RepID=A0A8K0I6A9_COCNU|nr:ubiquitin-like-specific protease ESD4 [Cocos nucifera]